VGCGVCALATHRSIIVIPGLDPIRANLASEAGKLLVMRGLDPRIPTTAGVCGDRRVEPWVEPGDDDERNCWPDQPIRLEDPSEHDG
jgi:hypothetical protein